MSKSLHPAEKYAHDVINGRIPACKYVKQSAERYFRDLKTLTKKGYYFDKKKAAAVISWVSQYCRHYKGALAKQPLELLPWQQFIYWQLFGWKDKQGNRRFKYVYVEVPKKNGKTTGFLAPIGIFMLLGDGEPGPEVYFAAGARDQAKIAFNDVRAMINASPELRACLQPYLNEIRPAKHSESYGVDQNFMCKPVSSEAGNLDGKNVHFSAIDELHNHTSDEVFNIMSSGMISREQPMQFTITTAGFNKYSFCYQYRDTITKILDQVIEDDSTLCVIYSVDEGDDWQDEKCWIKANPSIGKGKDLGNMRKEFIQKKNQGSRGIVEFKTKQLNIWEDSAETWIPSKEVKKVMKDVSQWPDLSAVDAYGGLDLAATQDITSFAVAARYDGKIYARVTHWLPADILEQKKALNDKHPYIQFAKKGLINLTPGNVTDYESVRQEINLQVQNHNIQSVGYDKFNATHLVSNLDSDGIMVNEVRQGFMAFNEPTKQLERMILSDEIVLENDPVLLWMFANVELEKDSLGNVRPSKKKAEKKIDGVVALLMAISELFRNENEGGNYIPDNYTVKKIKLNK
jgi:phage terminase large subunit-like protein